MPRLHYPSDRTLAAGVGLVLLAAATAFCSSSGAAPGGNEGEPVLSDASPPRDVGAPNDATVPNDARASTANDAAAVPEDGGGGSGSDGATITDAASPSDVVTGGAFAYGIVLAPNGSWDGVESPDAEVADLVRSGARYIRASRSLSSTAAGIPNSTETPYIQQMVEGKLSLGAAIIPQPTESVSDILAQGEAIKQSGFYDWVFVDHALQRTDIQEIMDGLAAQGWTKIMENDTDFGTPSQITPPPSGVWAHAFHFSALSAAAADPDASAIDAQDIAFIQYIHTHFPASVAVMKLEIDSEVIAFEQLPVATQKRLLTAWAHDQAVYGYQMIFPLFTDGNAAYNSQAVGTYGTQAMLMQ